MTMNKLFKANKILISIGLFIMTITLLWQVSIHSAANVTTTKWEKPISFVDDVNIVHQNGHSITMPVRESIFTEQPVDIIFDLSSYQYPSDSVFSIKTRNIELSVIANNQEIYHYKPQGQFVHSISGSTLHMIDIPNSLDNQQLIFHYYVNGNFLERISNFDITIGKKVDTIDYYLLKKEFSQLVLSIVMIYLFFIILFATSYIYIRQKNDFTFIYIGLICLLLGLYFFTTLWIAYFWLSKFHTMLHIIEYTSLMMIPIPLYYAFRDSVNISSRKIFDIAIIVSTFNAIVQIILVISGLKSLNSMVIYSHITLAIAILVITSCLYLSNKKQTANKKIELLSLVLIVFIVLFAILSYWITGDLSQESLYQFGAISFVIVQSYIVFSQYFDTLKIKAETEKYRELAVIDALTGLSNRTAFKQMIENKFNNNETTWIISIDLNDLKLVNDKYGHLYGDQMIVAMANALNKVFEIPNSYIFRVGGDEFIVFYDYADTIVNHLVISQEKKTIESSKHKIDQYNTETHKVECKIEQVKHLFSRANPHKNSEGYHFAYGYAYYSVNSRDSIEQFLQHVDRKMYRNKEEAKKQSGHS